MLLQYYVKDIHLELAGDVGVTTRESASSSITFVTEAGTTIKMMINRAELRSFCRRFAELDNSQGAL